MERPLPDPIVLIHPVSPEIQDRYAHGRCMFFAAALNRWQGWPIEADIALDPAGDYIEHAWVILPDGRAFDVHGPSPAANMPAGFADIEHRSIRTEAELRAFIPSAHQADWDAHVEEALAAIQAHWRLNPGPRVVRRSRLRP